MKKIGNGLRWATFLVLVLTVLQPVVAQVNLQVNIVPPYQSNISEYASRPDLILLTLTNTSTSTQNVQLRGNISGSNGVALILKEGFRSPSPIVLGPMETKTLNGNDLIHLFDYNNLELVGLSERDFINGTGLPEGTYDFCIRAFDYHQPSVPLSPEEPLGCTMLTITNLEPPTIVSPFHEQEIVSTGLQSFVITWSTPVGAPPHLRYRVRMVELLTDRDPMEAIWSANTFFERMVNQNTLLYGPAEPALTPGRRYALVVEAEDPLRRTAIRNNGQSEVVVFTYGENPALAGLGEDDGDIPSAVSPSAPAEQPATEKVFATHTVSGTLRWAFREQEHRHAVSLRQQQNMTQIRETLASDAMGAQVQHSGLMHAAGNLNGAIQNPTALLKADPTVGTAYKPSAFQSVVAQPAMNFTAALHTPLPVSASGATGVELSRVQSPARAASESYPLADGTLTVQARMKPDAGRFVQPGSPITVGTVTTNSEGQFMLEIVDPKFVGVRNVSLFLVGNMPDFEPFEVEIGSLDPEQPDLDVGEHTLIANTFRFQPSFEVEGEYGEGLDSELDVTVYREVAEIEANPHLKQEGVLSSQDRITKTINGKEMVAVGKAKAALSGKQYAAFGALFYSSSLWVEVVPQSEALQARTIRLAVAEDQVAKNEVLVVGPTYQLRAAPPSVSGRVVIKSGANVQGIAGAYVQVGFNPDDRAHTGVVAMPLMAPVTATLTSGMVPAGTQTQAQASVSPVVVASGMTLASGSIPAQESSIPAANWVGSGARFAAPAVVDNHGNFNALPELAQINIEEITYQTDAPYTVRTDSAGDFYIGNLPMLKPGASYTVRMIQLPVDYRNMAVMPETRVFTITPTPGSDNYQEFVVSPDLVTVSGRVVDQAGNPVRSARLNFQGGSSWAETGDDGTFAVQYYAGDHVLQIRKQGYMALDLPIEVSENAAQQLGDVGPLRRQSGNVRFVVHDQDDAALRLAHVGITAYDTTARTDAEGTWTLQGVDGPALVTVVPDTASGYVGGQYSIDVPLDGQITEVAIPLARGVHVYGKVSHGTSPVATATVEVSGRPYLKATTNDAGLYSLYVPAGEETLRAGKQGYVGAEEVGILQAGVAREINFELKDGGGKDLSTLLGFEIQLESTKPDPDVPEGEIWKGKFVNLQAHPELFEGTAVAELPFDKIHVTFDAQGKAIPKDGEVVTSKKSLPVRLFDYLPLRLEGDEYLTVKRNPEGKGSIGGKLRVDGQAFQRRALGINYGNLGKTYLTPHAESGIVDIEVFHEDIHGGVPEFTLQLGRLDQDSVAIELYGFNLTLDLARARVSQLGLSLAGSITTPVLGIIDSTRITVNALTISKTFGIESLLIDETTIPELRIGDWAARLGSVSLDEGGFRFNGSLDVDFPYSDKVTLAFEELRMAKDAIYGGKFHLPEIGMNVYHLLEVKTGINPLSFSRIGETDVYSLGGSAVMKLQKLISTEFEVNTLQIQTDGKFFIDIPFDKQADLGFASLAINGIDVSNPDQGAPYVSLRGEFKTEIPGLKFEVGNIRFTADASGNVNYAVDKVKATLDVPILTAGVELSLLDDAEKHGFAGAGTLAIPESPVSADIDFFFHRMKSGGGLALGGNFQTGAVIPIGSITIDKLGGGFSYASHSKAFSASIQGAISVTGLSSAAKLDNIDLTVAKDPLGVVIEGSVELVVADVLKLSKAHVMLNTPSKKMTVAVDAKFEPLPKLGALQVNGDFAVSWDENDTYAFFGAQAKASLLGFQQATVDYVMAFNVKNPKTNSNASVRNYFAHMDEDYNAPVFSGLYLYANLQTGKRINWEFERWWCPKVTVRAHYDARVQTTFISNFASNQYFLRLKGKAEFGGKAGVTVFNQFIGVGGDALFCFDIAGGYNNGWHFDGRMGGSLELYAGTPPRDCNDYQLLNGVGIRICADVYARLKYDGRLTVDGGLGSFRDNNAWCN